MKVFKRGICIVCLLVFSAVGYTAELQSDVLEAREKLSHSIEKSLDSLQTNRSRIQKQGEAVAAQLNMLRAKEMLSPKEHNLMENLLRKSQALNERMEDINRAIALTEERHKISVENIIEVCETQLTEVNRSLKSADDSTKSSLLMRMQALLNTKNFWESKFIFPKSSVPQNANLKLQPSNSDEEIRLKGDVLTDEAEAIRQEIKTVEKRIKSLSEERQLRQNVADMTKEMSLFNEYDELLGRQLAAANPSSDKLTAYDNKLRNTGEFAGTSAKDIFLPSPSQNVKSAHVLDSPNLNDQISILEHYKQRLISRADSLEQRAAWFYKKAEIRKY